MRALLAALALCALPPFAIAGSAEAPEIVDAQGDTRAPLPGGDILAAWLEPHDEGVTTVLQLVSLDAATAAGTDHYFSFRVGDEAYCTYAYGRPEGGFETKACRWSERSRFQSGGNVDAHGEVAFGAPATVRVHFPWSFLDAPPATLTHLTAETFDFKRPLPGHANPFLVDTATSDATYVVAPSAPSPTTSAPPPEAPVPKDVPVPAAVALLALVLAARRRS